MRLIRAALLENHPAAGLCFTGDIFVPGRAFFLGRISIKPLPCNKLSSCTILPALGLVCGALPALGATSLSMVSEDFGLGTRFQLMISKLAPLSRRIMMFSFPLRSGERRRFELARSCPVA